MPTTRVSRAAALLLVVLAALAFRLTGIGVADWSSDGTDTVHIANSVGISEGIPHVHSDDITWGP